MSSPVSSRQPGDPRHRLLLLIPHLAKGGAERQCSLLAQGLPALGWEVHVGHWQPDGADDPAWSRPGLHLHQLHGQSSLDPAILTRIVGLIRRHRPAIVHTWLRQMDLFGGAAGLLMGTPWVVAERSSAPFYTHWRDRLRRRLGAHAHLVIANSPSGRAYWQESGPAPPARVIANGLPAADIAATPPLPEPAGLPPLVVAVGRLIPSKHPLELLAALAPLLRAGRCRLALLGDGPLAETVRAEAARHEVGGTVLTPGRLAPAEVWAWLRQAVACVSLSDYEGQPNAVMEAMAAGCPLLVSDIPEHRAILDDSQAMLIDHDKPAAVADAIAAILTDPTAAARRAASARCRAQAWSVEAMVATYDRAYRDIIAGREGR